MTERNTGGMTAAGAQRLEYAIIGLGVIALVLIFQYFNITLFVIGSILVVAAGLLNNLLPLARPGVPVRTVVKTAMIIAMIFCIVLLIAMTAAHLYGKFFLPEPDANTMAGKIALGSPPYYMQPFTWGVAGVAVVLAALIKVLSRK